MLDRYLTMGHVRHPETGCPLPSLAAEIARADVETRTACEDGLVAMQRDIAGRLGSGEGGLGRDVAVRGRIDAGTARWPARMWRGKSWLARGTCWSSGWASRPWMRGD
ncbi:hypothetical protein ACU4GD_07815 [Cupriavidus basilensis]